MKKNNNQEEKIFNDYSLFAESNREKDNDDKMLGGEVWYN